MAYATWGWTAIGPGEVGLVRRHGRYVGRLGPGLHLRWPPPFERVTRLEPGRVRSLEIGFRTERADDSGPVRWESGHGRGAVARAEEEALLLTGDGQLVELAATAQYRLDADHPESLRAFAFGIADAEGTLRPLAESAVRTVVGRRSLDELLTSRRRDVERAAATLMQERARRYGLGLVVTGVEFQDVHPPLAVVDAYRDVSRAGSDRQRRVNEGNTERAEKLISARGQAAATVAPRRGRPHGEDRPRLGRGRRLHRAGLREGRVGRADRPPPLLGDDRLGAGRQAEGRPRRRQVAPPPPDRARLPTRLLSRAQRRDRGPSAMRETKMDLKRVADHVRFSIGQVMIMTGVIALALAPFGPVLRTPKTEWVVATIAYEVIFLPVFSLHDPVDGDEARQGENPEHRRPLLVPDHPVHRGLSRRMSLQCGRRGLSVLDL